MAEEKESKKTLVRDGRKPISQKKKADDPIQWDDVFSSHLSVDPELQAELDRKGLVPRWVDAKRMTEMNGYNDKGWRVYNRDKKTSDTINLSDFKYGNDPGGVVRRGSVVLAVKSRDDADRHRRFLNQRAEAAGYANAEAARELRSFASRSGLKNVQIYEGYEENEAPGI